MEIPVPLQQKFRLEKDTFGDLQVPADRYYGAQTQRLASYSTRSDESTENWRMNRTDFCQH